MKIEKLFPTGIYQTQLFRSAKKNLQMLNAVLRETEDLLEQDNAGHDWSKENYRNGYTSYASLNQLHLRSTDFGLIASEIDKQVVQFAKILGIQLGKRPLRMTHSWINVMPPNSHHSMHLHPLSVISGTFYVQVPKGASSIRFEDPRLDRFMNSPPRKDLTKEFWPSPGKLILFESWLRHEVPMNTTKTPRISYSFNYEWN